MNINMLSLLNYKSPMPSKAIIRWRLFSMSHYAKSYVVKPNLKLSYTGRLFQWETFRCKFLNFPALYTYFILSQRLLSPQSSEHLQNLNITLPWCNVWCGKLLYASMYMVTGSQPMLVKLTYRPSSALQLLGSLRISHKKFHV